MKFLMAALLVTGAVHFTPAAAQSPAASPLLGSWTVDVARMPMAPAERPKRVTCSFAEVSGGKWATHVDITGSDGVTTHSSSIAALDGTPAPIRNSPEADTVALKLPASNVLVMDLVRGGIPASTRVFTVAADGKTMIEIGSYVGSNGTPIMHTNYWTRQP